MLIVGTVYNQQEAMEITQIAKRFVVGNRARELAKQSRKDGVKNRCKECKTLLKRKYTDKKDKTLFCPNKKCKKFLGSI